MKFSLKSRRWPALLFLAGLTAGLLGEGLLLLQAQCRRIEEMLIEDFRVLAFLDPSVPLSRQLVVGEKIRALSGVEAVRFVAPEESLAELERRDPELVQSVALLGSNPLPGAFEIRLAAEEMPNFAGWLQAAQGIGELSDFRYKPLEIHGVLQVQFYSRFIAMVLSLGGFSWVVAAVWLLGVRRAWSDAVVDWLGPSTSGAMFGMGLAMLLAYPLERTEALRAWPSSWAQLALLAAASLVGWIWTLVLVAPEKHSRHAHADRGEEILGQSQTQCCPS